MLDVDLLALLDVAGAVNRVGLGRTSAGDKGWLGRLEAGAAILFDEQYHLQGTRVSGLASAAPKDASMLREPMKTHDEGPDGDDP